MARDRLTVHWEMDVARYNFVITDLSTCQRHLSVLLVDFFILFNWSTNHIMCLGDLMVKQVLNKRVEDVCIWHKRRIALRVADQVGAGL